MFSPKTLRAGAAALLITASVSEEAPLVAAENAKEEPSFERLVELNGSELFGGQVKVDAKKGRVVVRYVGKGLFNRGFVARSSAKAQRGFFGDGGEISSSAMRDRLVKGMEKQLSVVGLSAGIARSRFELEDDYRISFRLRIPELGPRAKLTWLLNQRGRKEYVRSNFLRDLAISAKRGRRQLVRAEDKRYHAPAFEWFDRDAPKGVQFEILCKDKKLVISKWKMEGEKAKEKETLVSVDGLESPQGGAISLVFSGMSFSLADFEIDTKLPRAWLEKELAKMRKAGSLRIRPEAPKETKKDAKKKESPAAPPDPTSVAKRKKSTKEWEKEVEVDLGKKDPEIGEDL